MSLRSRVKGFLHSLIRRDDRGRVPGTPRRFKLVRTEDASGVSGTGVVAYGIEYADGAVHMQWCNRGNQKLTTLSNGCSFKPAPDGIRSTEEIHGHGGRTQIEWIDDPH